MGLFQRGSFKVAHYPGDELKRMRDQIVYAASYHSHWIAQYSAEDYRPPDGFDVAACIEWHEAEEKQARADAAKLRAYIEARKEVKQGE